MNRYVHEGIARDVEAGKRVAVLAATHDAAAAAFTEVRETRPGWAKVYRAAGAQRLEHESGGVAVFVSVRGNGYRGLTADTLVLVDGLAGWRGIKSNLAPIAPEVIG